MNSKFNEFREKYPDFIYHDYTINQNSTHYLITYNFEISGLVTFKPTLKIAKAQITNRSFSISVLKNLVFQVGLVELLSYVKCTCSPRIIIRAGYLSPGQLKWWQKLYYYGLGEFLYINGIKVKKTALFKLIVESQPIKRTIPKFRGAGNLIPVGGGKDSIVSLEILKEFKNTPFMINAKPEHIDCIVTAGYDKSDSFLIERKIDHQLLELNEKGFLNGHTPFSTLVIFLAYLGAYLTKRQYVVLSNEASANEATIIGTKINHQYSKSYEFERDFNFYAKKYLKLNIKCFSLLRMLNESQISFLFCQYPQYRKVFKSCNVGSKETPWVWCGHCPKCLFVYIILSQYLTDVELQDIFGRNLYDDKSLLNIFLKLLGQNNQKPFECVGTRLEVHDAISRAIEQRESKLPYLLQYYATNFKLQKHDLLHEFNRANLIPTPYKKLIRKELAKYG